MISKTALRVIESCTDPGNPAAQNEDALGASPDSAFVIDGATGLGDKQLMPGNGTDAAWLAVLASKVFEKSEGIPVAEIVREINRLAEKEVSAATGGIAPPRWALPVAGFQMIRVEENRLIGYGLGDCRLFVLSLADGTVFETSAMKGNPEHERRRAKLGIERAGGLAALRALNRDPVTREELRRGRARYNTEDGFVWTLGTAPEAGDHLVREAIDLAAPVIGLLCTDGFAALTDQYGRYEPAGLIQAARQRGLSVLLSELRDIERNQDPDGLIHPRFKVSDDATAILFEASVAKPA